MKKMKYALHAVAVLAMATLAAACSNDNGAEVKPTGAKQAMTLTAYQPGSESETRVGFGSNGVGYWQAGDKIGVISYDSESGDYAVNEFSIKDGADKAKATFTGTLSHSSYYFAMYPYNDGHKYQASGPDVVEGTYSYYYNLPSSYNYTAVDQDYSQADGNSFCMPMFGTISGNAVTFKNIGGVICMKIDEMPAASGTVTVKDASKKLCGSFGVYPYVGTDPSISTYESTSDNTVTFNYSGATAGQPGVFYLPVAVGKYNLTVTVAGGEKSYEMTTAELDMTRSKLKKVDISNHTFVDLNLPSGTLWAETNIGAATSTDYGDYFAWGETTAKTSFSWSNYKWGTSANGVTKYNSTDNKTVLDAADDAATAKWGAKWHTPTREEFEELSNTSYCTWTWTSKTASDGNTTINGYEVKSTKNDNSIFLPAPGCYYGENGLIYQGTMGLYWSSSVIITDTTNIVIPFVIADRTHTISETSERSFGCAIRPVADPQK